jgi:prepilin-type processing-associated H-X9-DG protein
MNQSVGTMISPPLRPVDGPWLDGDHDNPPNDLWLRYAKSGDLTRPGPSMTWILVDEHPDSINDGALGVDCAHTNAEARIIDYPASFHNGACGFAFADGHSVVHKWKDPRTMPPPVYADGALSPTNTPNNPDVAWIQEHTSAPR